jgi:hypothetical protein
VASGITSGCVQAALAVVLMWRYDSLTGLKFYSCLLFCLHSAMYIMVLLLLFALVSIVPLLL